MADWYVTHLGFSVARSGGAPAHGRFLLDDSGSVMVEIYHNPDVTVPDYTVLSPFHLHLAFVSEDPAADRDRLVKAGARVFDDVTTAPNGDRIMMLRDPWGVPLQFVQRTRPMLPAE